MKDVVIIGAGVVGGFIARELSKYQLSVLLVDKQSDVGMGATRANSAIVHAGFDARCGSLKARLNVRGARMMKSVCRELGVKYERNGALVVGFGDEDERTLEELYERGISNGVEGLRIVSGEELYSLEPSISRDVSAALYAPTSAICCPYELCIAAVGNAMDNGVELRLGFTVEKIESCDGGYKIVSSGKEEIAARCVINAAGVFSDEIAAMVDGRDFTVKPRRGEYILLDKECSSLLRRTVFRCPSEMGKGVLVSPTVDGNVIVGPSANDIDDKTDTATTIEVQAWVKETARQQVEGLDFRKAITTFSGLRATGSTGDFIISSPRENFINVAGIESPGLTSAPAIGEYVAEMLAGMGVELSAKADFDPHRRAAHWFSALGIEEKNEIIKARPEYGRIICRCELITEGEIVDAIRTNPRPTDLDGVKRRTRATMGRCQGGFCSPQVVEILARELDVPYEAITKSGGGSYLNIGRTKEVL